MIHCFFFVFFFFNPIVIPSNSVCTCFFLNIYLSFLV
uniref:Uncharacterized protein n=1 Tax=Anguilla anguilla TaxID=7936 RepID=A0A0E9Q487_ANGAN